MKRSLPLVLALAGSAAAVSAAELKEPVFYGNSAIQCVSPNGKWAVSEVYGTVVLINVDNGNNTVFEASETGSPYYNIGLGNVLSDSGILLCATEATSDATYYENGEWKKLHTGDAKDTNSSANGITPDGSRICGNLGLMAATLDDVTMLVPAVWNRQADGTYSDYVLLPHPELDITGRAPQYITAVAISDDGRTVVGQIVDCRGSFQYPIVYTEDADGKWSYTLPTGSLMNPDKVEIPENPGESPSGPDPMAYLDEEMQAAYDNAYNEWVASGYQQELYPNAINYMTAEQRAAYEAEEKEYQTAIVEWYDKFDAFNNAYWAIVDASPNFQFNQVAVSADGKSFAMTNIVEEESDPMSWMMPSSIETVWEFRDGVITKYEDRQLGVKAYGGDYLLAVETDKDTNCYNGYLLKDGEALSLYDYLCSKGEDIKEWVDLNMSHDTEIYDYETDEVVVKKLMYTGLPVASRDMGVLASWTQSMWGDYAPESYLFDFRDPSGIKTVAAGNSGAVTVGPDGSLRVTGDVTSLAVYGLGGACLMQVSAPGSTVDCRLAPGVYVVRAEHADGSASVTKIVR